MEQHQIENAQFMMRYLKNANGPQFRNYFASYNDKMFAQVSRYVEFSLMAIT